MQVNLRKQKNIHLMRCAKLRQTNRIILILSDIRFLIFLKLFLLILLFPGNALIKRRYRGKKFLCLFPVCNYCCRRCRFGRSVLGTARKILLHSALFHYKFNFAVDNESFSLNYLQCLFLHIYIYGRVFVCAFVGFCCTAA